MLQGYRFYLFLGLIVLGIPIWQSKDLFHGPLPTWPQAMVQSDSKILKQPRLVYVWGKWCGICNLMRSGISTLAQDTPVLTIALNSGDDAQLQNYLHAQGLNWNVLNDQNGQIANSLGVVAVPALFFLNRENTIVLTSTGFTSLWGMRVRLWLAQRL